MKSLQSIVFFLFLLLTSGLQSQTIDLDNFKSMDIRNIGPAGMSGRVTAIDVNMGDTDIIFIGTASGGVWKSINGGISWEPIFDDQPALSIGSIKINQKNTDEIWVGTGEGNPRNSLNTGSGIFKTIDGGKSWKRMGLENSKAIHRIIIHRDNPDIVFAGVIGSPWGDHPERGLFRTKDGGKTWQKVLFANEHSGIADMVADPSNPNKIIAAMWDHKRTPWDFYSGGKGSGLYITYDAGDNWKQLTEKEGLPKGDLGRIGIAISPSKPNIVYALVEAEENGLYTSTDGGEKWKLVSTKNIGNRPFYYSEIYVDPLNENRIYNLWTYVSRSQDGGKTFTTIMDYGNNVHPDHHAFWIHPHDPSYLIDGNDGGLNISRDGGETWRFASNIPVGQFYHINIDNDWPYNVYGGMQDNGSWIGPSSVLKRGGIRNNDWQELSFGDGFDVVPLRTDSRYGYSMSQGGNVGFYDRETGSTQFVQPEHPEGKPLRYNWNAAIAQDPFADCGVYFGSQYVHFSSDCGNSWKIISPDLTTNDTLKQKQDVSGGLTIDATNAENYTTIVSIAPSPHDKNVVWVGTDDGNLQLTKDGGKNWSLLSRNIKGMPNGAWITQIEVSRHNAGEVFVIANDYRRNNYKAFAFHTEDFGKSWKQIADDKYFGSFLQCMVQDPVEANLLFAGADDGLYISFDKGKNWQRWDKEFPRVQVSDLKIQEREADLVIATFGRAMWVMDDIRPLREIAKTKMEVLKNALKVFPPNEAYLVDYRSYDGIRFIAQGEFVGDNRRHGVADLKVWKKPTEKDKKTEKANAKADLKGGTNTQMKKNAGKKKDDKAKIIVRNSQGDTIRTFTSKLEEGLNHLTWNLNVDGVSFPSRRKPKKDEDKNGGYNVLPGDYQIIIQDGHSTDSTWVKVMMDPRSKMSVADMEDIQNAQRSFYATVESASKAYGNIREAKSTIKRVSALLSLQEDSIQTEIKELHKKLNTTLDSLSEVFMEKEGLKGIQRNPKNINSLMGRASYYLGSSWKKPGDNAMNAVQNASEKVSDIIDAINLFLASDWKDYEDKIKSLELKLIEELKPVSKE